MDLKFRLEPSNGKFCGRLILIWGLLMLVSLAPIDWASAQNAQRPALAQNEPNGQLSSAQFIGQNGLTVDRLITLGFGKRADLLAARARLAIAEGRLQQARLRPNPSIDSEYGSPRFLGGEAESDFSVGVTQVFETGGRRSKRVAVATLELAEVRAEVTALERRYAVEIRQNYTSAINAARQLDVLEKLISVNEETVRATAARLKEGDVAPLDLNLVRVENDRLKVQAIQARGELETNLIGIKTLIGTDVSENLQLAPQPERPPRLDLGLAELTALAFKNRADLQAAKINEELGTAQINLARSLATPNIAGTVRYTRNKQIIDFPATVGSGGGSFPNTDNSLTFGVSVEIPVFNRNQGEIASATAGREQAARNREFLEATIKRDVAIAFRRYRAASESLVLYASQILPRAEENLRSIRAAYGFGEFSVLDVVAEQRRLTENVTGYNQSLRDYYTALAELETALGTTIPATGFAPSNTSVLPERDVMPEQIDRQEFLQTTVQPPALIKKVEAAKQTTNVNKSN